MEVACKLCGSPQTIFLEEVDKKPTLEVDYGIPAEKYRRSVHQCKNCGVYFNHHNLLDLKTFYEGMYNASIDKAGLLRRFNRIMSLPKQESDNYGRVQRIVQFMGSRQTDTSAMKVLDVGSGTCVFLAEMKNFTPHVYCIDPDTTAVEHAKEVVEVTQGHCGTLESFESNTKFDLISFNKVLEHVEEPIAILKQASNLLTNQGVIYLELPEGDRIYEQGLINQRLEFAVEHITVFNPTSIRYLAEQAGLKVVESEVITDPSGKFTIFAYLVKQ